MGILEAINFFLSLIQGAESASSLTDRFRKKGKIYSDSPFFQTTIKDLNKNVSNPLNFVPQRVERNFEIKPEPGITIISGSSGTGKTREAIELLNALSKIHGTDNVLLVKGNITEDAPLPAKINLRKVLVLVEDYDYGIETTASESFLDRDLSHVRELYQLKKLFNKLDSNLELISLIITVNGSRFPFDENSLLSNIPNAHFYQTPPLLDNEFEQFVSTISKSLKLKFQGSAFQDLILLNDGRFDTVSTYLSSFEKGSKIGKVEVEQYRYNQNEIWKFFKTKLSDEQRTVYELIAFFKNFSITLNIQYILHLTKKGNINISDEKILTIINSLWKTNDSTIIVYDAQFAQDTIDEKLIKDFIEVISSLDKKFLKENRYSFQNDMKNFCLKLADLKLNHLRVKVLRKLKSIFPLDRYFAYELALHLFNEGHLMRSHYELIRVLKRPTILSLYSGKWIEIQIHLLLAKIYLDSGYHKGRSLKAHLDLEDEFRIAASLADSSTEDLTENSFQEINSDNGEGRELLGKTLREFGYVIPPNLNFESQKLRALVHHEYANYLMKEKLRDYDLLKHEEVVINLSPEYEVPYINCAIVSNRIGNSKDALKFINQAELRKPSNLQTGIFKYFIEREKLRAYESLGEIEMAKSCFINCQKAIQGLDRDNFISLNSELQQVINDHSYWKRKELISQLRTKSFSSSINYRLNKIELELNLPIDWKIAAEEIVSTFTDDKFCALFSSQVVWNRTTLEPENGSIELSYLLNGQSSQLSPIQYGESHLQAMKSTNRVKMAWAFDARPFDKNKIKYYRWNYSIQSGLGMIGFILIFELPTTNLMLNCTSLKSCSFKFLPIYDELIQSLLNQLESIEN